MKKTELINPALSQLIARLGHSDMLVVADAGLPIPDSTQRIDLALTKGVPTFIETLKVILSEMYVEKAIVAEDIIKKNPVLYQQLKELLGSTPLELISHIEFKQQTHSACAIIRTGEFTPYANVILVSGAWGFGL
jgi:D-ribose pyranase